MELSIVTACSRPHFLPKLYESIDFDKIKQWIIVYDTSKGYKFQQLYPDNPKILELESEKPTLIGGVPKTMGIQLIESGFVYIMDDDNIVHPDFWKLIDSMEFDSRYFYTFNSFICADGSVLYGNQCKTGTIDTSQYIIPRNMIGTNIWDDTYDGDGKFIEKVYNANKDKLFYINKVCSYYNFLTKVGIGKNTTFVKNFLTKTITKNNDVKKPEQIKKCSAPVKNWLKKIK